MIDLDRVITVTMNTQGSYKTEGGLVQDVTIHDLSRGGCAVEDHGGRLIIEESIRLCIVGTGPYLCDVTWLRAGKVGLEFQTPLQDDVFDLLIHSQWDQAWQLYEQRLVKAPPMRFI